MSVPRETFTPDERPLMDQISQDLNTWSIGKIRAIVQGHGIKAGKMKRAELVTYAKLILYRQQQPITFDVKADDLDGKTET